MNILAQIAPGLRELRTPFASGALWVAGVLLLLYPDRASLSRRYSDLADLYGSLSPIVQSGALAALVYAVGIVSSRMVLGVAANIDRENEYSFPGGKVRLPGPLLGLATFAYGAWLWLVEIDYRGSAGRRFIDASLPDGTSLVALAIVPEAHARTEMDVAIARLSQESPALYDTIERQTAEMEFRLAVALPLLFFVCCLATYFDRWGAVALIVCGLVAAVAMIRDGAHKGHAASKVWLSALESGIVRLPYLERLNATLADNADRNDVAIVLEWMLTSDREYVRDDAVRRCRALRRMATDGYWQEVKEALGPETRHALKHQAEYMVRRGKVVDPFATRRLASALYFYDALRPIEEIPVRFRSHLKRF